MDSTGSHVDLSQTDQSITQQPPQQANQNKDIRRTEFETVGTSQNPSKRPGAKCKHCQQEIEPRAATVEYLKKHILKDCTTVPQDVRQHWLDVFSSKQASSTAGEQAVLAGVKRKAQHQQDIRRHLASRDWDLTESERESVSYDLLRFAVTANLGFKQFNNVHLHAAFAKLRPQYRVPSPTAFTMLLDREYLGVMEKIRVKIRDSQNLTLSLDCWTDACKRSILAFVLQFPDRTLRLLESRELSLDRHTGELLAGGRVDKVRTAMQTSGIGPLTLQCLIHPCLPCCSLCSGIIKEVVDTHKLREKLAMLVTDNAANMVLARRLVVESVGFKHILEMRWVGGLHAYSM
jgi:hypothetical protein